MAFNNPNHPTRYEWQLSIRFLLFVILLTFIVLFGPTNAASQRRRSRPYRKRTMCYSVPSIDRNKIRGNYCPRVQLKMVACRIPNGTETYRGRVKVGNKIQFMTLKRPRLVPSFKEVSEVVYGCCPGFEGDNCDAACFNCTQMHDLASRVKTLEAKILRSPSSIDYDGRKSPSIKMGRPDTSHVTKKKHFRDRNNRGSRNNRRNKIGGSRSDIDILEDAGDDGSSNNSVIARLPTSSRPFYNTRRDSRSCRCPSGPPGPPGPPGATNMEKNSEVVYRPGPSGPPGIVGPPGEMGIIGIPGIGLPGAKGDLGIDGIPGERGFTGPPGIEGIIGPVGPKGEQGIGGLDGRPGSKGDPGLVGFTGIKGDRGEIGFPGQPGNHGNHGIGSPGPPGLPGPPGDSVVLPNIDGGSGYGVFTDSEDDFPLYPNYSPSEVDLSSRINKGEKGAKGELGMQGFIGIKGERGFDGVRGSPGDAGLTGLPGLKGDRGVSGQPGLTYLPGAGSDPAIPQSVKELYETVGELRRSVNLLDSRIRILEVELPKILGNTRNNQEARFPGHPDEPHESNVLDIQTTTINSITNHIDRLNGIVENALPGVQSQPDDRYIINFPSYTNRKEQEFPVKTRTEEIDEHEIASKRFTSPPTIVTNKADAINISTGEGSLGQDYDDYDRYEGSGISSNSFPLLPSNSSSSGFDDDDYGEYYEEYSYVDYHDFDDNNNDKRTKRKLSDNKGLPHHPFISPLTTSTTPKSVSSLMSNDVRTRVESKSKANEYKNSRSRNNLDKSHKLKLNMKKKSKYINEKNGKSQKTENKELTWI